MATVRNIVTRSLRRVNITDAGEEASARDADAALEAYNELFFAWVSEGVDTSPAVLGLDDTFPLATKHERGVIALLGIRLADDYDEEVTPILARDADTGWRMLQADYVYIEPLRSQEALQEMPSLRRFWRRFGV